MIYQNHWLQQLVHFERGRSKQNEQSFGKLSNVFEEKLNHLNVIVKIVNGNFMEIPSFEQIGR